MEDKIYYLGLDCSSKAIHGVIIDEEENIVGQYKWASKNKSSEQRLLDFSKDFLAELSTITYTLFHKEGDPIPRRGQQRKGIQLNHGIKAAVESAIFIQNPKATIAIASVVGVVRFICMLNGIECCYVDNTKWKRNVVGKGNCSKQDIKAFATNKWGDIFKEQDYADAACIALWRKKEKDNGKG